MTTRIETVKYDSAAFVLDVIYEDGDKDLLDSYGSFEEATKKFEKLTEDSIILRDACRPRFDGNIVGLELSIQLDSEQIMEKTILLRRVKFKH